jgi:hypothetical protein
MSHKKRSKAKASRGLRAAKQGVFDIDFLRLLPFWLLAALSLMIAYRAPYGRRPPEFDFDISLDAILWSLQKPLHIAACALLMVLGVMAYKWKRWWLAAVLTMLVGLGWEIAQTTVAGHNPRLADLVPDFLGVVLGWLIVEGLRHALKPDDHIFG